MIKYDGISDLELEILGSPKNTRSQQVDGLEPQPVQHLIADPRETQLIAMFRCIDDRAQKTMLAMMGVAFNMHKKVGK